MPHPDKKHVVFVEAAQCKACKRCELACIASHHGVSVKEAAKLKDQFSPRVQVVKTATAQAAILCRQCKDAPCAQCCPTGAIFLEEDGRSIMRPELCIGCGMCKMACPYGAINKDTIKLTEVEEAILNTTKPKIVALRCDLCVEWRESEKKELSACVEACPFGAMRFVTHEEFAVLEAKEAAGEKITPLPKPAKKTDKAEKKPTA